MASSIQQLTWIQDGIDDKEAEAIQNLLYIAVVSRTVASSVVSLGWVEDGIGEIEVKAIEEISYIAHRNAEVASSVVSMGWVQDGIRRCGGRSNRMGGKHRKRGGCIGGLSPWAG